MIRRTDAGPTQVGFLAQLTSPHGRDLPDDPGSTGRLDDEDVRVSGLDAYPGVLGQGFEA